MKRTKTSTRALAVGIVSLTALGLTSACGDPPTRPNDFTIALIALGVEPDPVPPQVSTDPEFDFAVSFTVILTEARGTGTTIDSVSVTDVTETLEADAVESEEDVLFRAEVSPESDRIEGRSSTRVAFNVYYKLPGGGKEARINIALSITDDLGYQVGGNLQVRIEEPAETPSP